MVSILNDEQISGLEGGSCPTISYDFDALYNEMPPPMQNSLSHQHNSKEPARLAKLWFDELLYGLRKPVAVFPERRNIRLIAQSGMFTLSGGDYLPKKCERNGIGCRKYQILFILTAKKQGSS
jgi:hypothetical protein